MAGIGHTKRVQGYMMKNVTVMLFAGTTEGRRLCGYLAEKSDTGFITHVYVTTEYGKRDYFRAIRKYI